MASGSFFDVVVMRKLAAGPEVQDPQDQADGEYCLACLQDGRAMGQLLDPRGAWREGA